MRYVIEEAPRGGFIVTKQEKHYLEAMPYAAGSTLDEVLARIQGGPMRQKVQGLSEWARDIVAIHNGPETTARKVSMIRLLHSITGVGLKEAKDAIEAALDVTRFTGRDDGPGAF